MSSTREVIAATIKSFSPDVPVETLADAILTALGEDEWAIVEKGDSPGAAFDIGYRDGYETAVQEIDVLTGGDGEYRYCTNHDPELHTPDAPAMKARIAERFNGLRAMLASAGGKSG